MRNGFSLLSALLSVVGMFSLVIGSVYIYNTFFFKSESPRVLAAISSVAPLANNSATTSDSGTLSFADCAPHNSGDILNQQVINLTNQAPATAQTLLQQIQATCTPQGYLKPDGQRIQFYTLGGCYGWSADKIKNFVAAQESTIQSLEKDRNYFIIETACNPHTLP